MPRSCILISIRQPSPETCSDVPIVADAKEAIEKMLEYVTECNTQKWLEEWASGSEAPYGDEEEADHDIQDILER